MEVKPFKAFRYDKAKVGDPGDCIAPPYDVIDSDQQNQLYGKSPYNIVRIIKGMTSPTDSDSDNQYTRAADYLKVWIFQGVIKQDSAESIYSYVQDFQLSGRVYQRLSFIALGKLEEFGKIVRPHEQIFKGPLIDRLNLKRATKAKFGLVFMLYEDKLSVADEIMGKSISGEPLVDLTDEQEVRHRLFAITDENDINAICEMMSDKSVVIADGHHRYTTGLEYAKENTSPAAQYQMLAFANTLHEGLIVLATHRLVGNLENYDSLKMLTELQDNFEVRSFKFDTYEQKLQAKQDMTTQMKAEQDSGKNAIGVYDATGAFYLAVLKNAGAMASAAPDKSPAWRSFDVAVLCKLILDDILGLDDERLASGENVEYVKDAGDKIDEIIARVEACEKQVAFFLNGPKMEQIQQVADQGERMPQKSTYFYPKIFTGLTINKL